MTFCDECGGIIDPLTLSCTKCGLEALHVQDLKLIREPGDTATFGEGVEKDKSGEGIVNQQKGEKMGQFTKSSRVRGYSCLICTEWFKKESERFALEAFGGFNINQSGTELSGSNLTTFIKKQDLFGGYDSIKGQYVEGHYQRVHKVRRIAMTKHGPIVILLDGTTRMLSSYRIRNNESSQNLSRYWIPKSESDKLRYSDDFNGRKEIQILRSLGRKFGISTDLVYQIRHSPCGICGMISIEPMEIDHNHDTGEIRGPLCSFCNRAEGYIARLKKDGLVEKMLKYGTPGNNLSKKESGSE